MKQIIRLLTLRKLLLAICITGLPFQPLFSQMANPIDDKVKTALSLFVPASELSVTGLQVVNNADGSKTAKGNISIFHSNAVGMEGVLSADTKVKSLKLTFPASFAIDIEQLNGFFGGPSLKKSLPAGFPTSTGLTLQSMEMNFESNGTTLEVFKVNLGVVKYEILGLKGFSIEQVGLEISANKPTKPERSLSGTLSGNGQIGAFPLTLSSTLSTDPADISFTGRINAISIATILNSFVDGAEATTMLGLIPEVFKSASIDTLTLSINPATKTFKGLGNTSFGTMELQVRGASGGKKPSMQLGVAPPASFKFADVAPILAPLDGIELSRTAFIVSTLADDELSTELPGLEDQKGSLVKGVNMFSTIKFEPDLAKMMKADELNLQGFISENGSSAGMSAALGLNLDFSSSVSLKKVMFSTIVRSSVPVIEFGISGLLEAMVGKDRLSFQAGVKCNPFELKFSGDIFMQALKKENSAEVLATIGADDKSEPPEWTEPFGIPGFGLNKLGGSAGIDVKFVPIFLNKLGFLAQARLGTVADRSKHIRGALITVVDVTNPANSLFQMNLTNLKILSIIEAFQENPPISGILRTMLDVGLDSGKVLVVPTDGIVAFGKTYTRGISFSAGISIAGLKGRMDFSLNDEGITGSGSIDPINLGDGVFKVEGRNTDRPQVNFKLMKNSFPELLIDGKATLLGISSETFISFNADTFEFITAGKFLNLFEAIIEVKGTSFNQVNNPGFRIRASLRNDLVAELNRLATQAIDDASKSTKETLMASRKELEDARVLYTEVDGRLQQRMAEITSRREADLRRMREEAQRSMNEKQSVINYHQGNINSINAKLVDMYANASWWKPWTYAAIAVQESAKLFHQTAIETEHLAYAGYSETVKGLATLGDNFPKEIEQTDLFIERGAKFAAVETAIAGVDVADGVSQVGLSAAKAIVDGALGGIVDIRTAEIELNLGLENKNTFMVGFNITFLKSPYNFKAAIDFNNLAGSAATLGKDIVSGTLLKPGFSSTFGADLEAKKKLVKMPTGAIANTLTTESKIITYEGNELPPPPPPVFTYTVTVETADSLNAGSAARFEVSILGANGNLMHLPLAKELFSAFQPGSKKTFSFYSNQNIGKIQRISIKPIESTLTDNLIVSGIGVSSSIDPMYQFSVCPSCDINSSSFAKTLGFDGRAYTDYSLLISTRNVKDAGTDEDIRVKLIGEKGESEEILLNVWAKENAFEKNTVDQYNISIPEIGALKSVFDSARHKVSPLTDMWGFGGITVRSANGTVQSAYCNCEMTNSFRTLPLESPNDFAELKVKVKTLDETSAGTDATISMIILDDKNNNLSGNLELHKIITSTSTTGFEFIFGDDVLINLFERGQTDLGFITTKKFGCIKTIRLKNTPTLGIPDEWNMEFIELKIGEKLFRTKSGLQINNSEAQVEMELIDPGKTITCPDSMTVSTKENAQCGAVVSYPNPTLDNDCNTYTFSRIAGLASGSVFPVGVTTNTFQVNGIANRSCSFTITVEDKTAPNINCPQDKTVNNTPGACGANVNYSAMATDNCDTDVPVDFFPLSGTFFPPGTYPVKCTSTDAAGNLSHCTFEVTVRDIEAPTINCPTDLLVNTPPDQCSTVVGYATPIGSDNCTVSSMEQTEGLASGMVFPVGVTRNAFRVTDQANLTVSCVFNVTVRDRIPPFIQCSENITLHAEPGLCTAKVSFTSEAFDNCSAVPVLTHSRASGTVFPIGATTVTSTATDAGGNTVSCSFNVSIVDNQEPAIQCPDNIRRESAANICGLVLPYAAPVGTDNCAGQTTSLLNGLAPGAVFPVGVTTNIFQVTDRAGLKASCNFNVTIRDETPPQMICPKSLTQSCEISLEPATVGNPVVTDNCGVKTVGHQDVKTPGNCPGNFIVTRTWSAEDIHENTNACIQVITVQDKTAPVIKCPANITVVCDTVPATSTGIATSVDNCDAEPGMSHSDKLGDGFCDWLCNIKRTWVAIDHCGNTSTCLQIVTKDPLPLIEKALNSDVTGDNVPDLLLLGNTSSTLSIAPGQGNCIQKWLPGSGTLATGLKFEKKSPGADCKPGTNPIAANGQVTNPLLAETLKLNLFVRLNPALGKTALSPSCVPESVMAFVGPTRDVNALLKVANGVLGNFIQTGELFPQLLESLRCINAPLNLCR